MQTGEPWVVIAVSVFGAGGLVSLVKAYLDWRGGKAQKESETEVRYLVNREKRIALLEKRIDVHDLRRESDARYLGELIRALARAGVDIPDRRD